MKRLYIFLIISITVMFSSDVIGQTEFNQVSNTCIETVEVVHVGIIEVINGTDTDASGAGTVYKNIISIANAEAIQIDIDIIKNLGNHDELWIYEGEYGNGGIEKLYFDDNDEDSILIINSNTATIRYLNNDEVDSEFTINWLGILPSTNTVTHNCDKNGLVGGAEITSLSGTAPYDYLWSGDGETVYKIEGKAAGKYFYTVTDAEGCQAIDTVSILEPPVDSVGVNKIELKDACYGDNNGEVKLVGINGYMPSWYKYKYKWHDAITDSLRTDLSKGIYSFTVTDGLGCEYKDTIEINQSVQLQASVSIVKDISCHTNNINGGATDSDAQLSVSVVDAAKYNITEYKWQDDFIGESRNDGGISTSYSYQVTYDNNCLANSNVISLSLPEELTIDITEDISISCHKGNGPNDDAELSTMVTGGAGGYLYKWYAEFNNHADTIHLIIEGKYTCEVMDANLCIASDTIDVFEPTLLEIPALNVDTANNNGWAVSCFDGSDGYIEVTPIGGTIASNYGYSWKDGTSTNIGQSGAKAVNLEADSYTVSVTDDYSCLATITVVIHSPDEITYDTIIKDVKNYGEDDGEIEIKNIQNAIGVVTSSWTGDDVAQNNLKQTTLIAGFYTATLEDENNCTVTGTFEVAQPTEDDGGTIELNNPNAKFVCYSNLTNVEFDNASIAFNPSDVPKVDYTWEHNYNNTGWVDIPSTNANNYIYNPNDYTYEADLDIRRRADKMKNGLVDKTAYSNLITLKYLPNRNPSLYSLADKYCQNADSSLIIGIPSGGYFTPIGKHLVDNGDGTAWFIPDSVNLINNNPQAITVTYNYKEEACISLTDSTTTVNPTPNPFFALNSQYSNTSIAVVISNCTPLGGVFSGQGVITTSTETTFNPDQLAAGNYDISYAVDSSYGCSETYTRNVSIVSGAGNIIDINTSLELDVFCYDGDTVWLEAEPLYAVDSGKFASPFIVQIDDTLGYFIPSIVGIANADAVVSIDYYYYSGGSAFPINSSITIYDVNGKAQILDLLPSYCNYNQQETINANTLLANESGEFFGPNGFASITSSIVLDMNNITPLIYGVDPPHTLTYVYTHSDPKSSCTDTLRQTFAVYALDSVGFITKDTFNISDTPVLIDNRTPLNNGERFSANVFVNNFEYSPTILGINNITLTYENNNTHCINAYTKPVYVDTARGIFHGLDANNIYCLKGSSDTIWVSAVNGIKGSGTFSIDGNIAAYEAIGVDSLVIHPWLFEKDEHRIISFAYTGIDGINTYTSTQQIYIDDVGILRMNSLDDKYCNYNAGITIGGTIEIADGSFLAKGSFSSTDPSLNDITDNDGKALFTASNALLASNKSLNVTIRYSYSSEYSGSSCSDYIDSTTTIHAPPEISFDMPAVYNRAGGTDNLMAFVSPAGGVFSGNVAVNSDGVFAFANVAPGVTDVTIRYDYTNTITACTSNISDNTKVLTASGSIGGVGITFCYEDLNHDITANVTNSTGVIVPIGFKGLGIFDIDISDEEATINPKTAYDANGDPTASYVKLIVTYVYDIEIDGDRAQFQLEEDFSINNVTNVSFVIDENFTSVCSNHDKINLVNYTGGTTGNFYLGATLLDNDNFYPTADNVGDNIIVFRFNNGTCNVERDDTITVHALPLSNFSFTDNISTFAEFDKMCIGDSITLFGNLLGGVFSGSQFDSLRVDAADSIRFKATQAIPVTFSYTYTNDFYCDFTLSKTIDINSNPDLSFSDNFVEDYCINGSAITIYGKNNDNQISEGYFNGNNIHDTDSNGTYVFNPTTYINYNIDTIAFNYTDKNGCSSIVIKEIEVGELPVISINGLEFNDYCPYIDDKFNVYGNQGVNNSSDGLAVGGINYSSGSHLFKPSEYAHGSNVEFIYTYTNGNNCTNIASKTVRINSLPISEFEAVDKCISNAIEFEYTGGTFADSIKSFLWRFNVGNDSAIIENPIYRYTVPNDFGYNVNLIVTNTDNCVDNTTNNIDFNWGPMANFNWVNECNGDEMNFTNTTAGNARNWTWLIDGVEISVDKQINYIFNNIGEYEVTLIAEESPKCKHDTTKTVSIRPVIIVDAENEYFDSFNNEYSGWAAELISEYDSTTWQNALPAGVIINSDNNAWVTNAIGNYKSYDNSAITSPCFNLSALKKPMVSMQYISDLDEGRDGVVMQYLVEGEDVWKTIGTHEDGSNWFNYIALEIAPGGSLMGWTGATNGWQNAKHDLDSLLGVKNNVRFRILFASNGDGTAEGFAFDDFRISERTKRVLIEHFTNSESQSALNADNRINSLVGRYPLDAIDIQYHTSYPSGDKFYYDYPTGSNVRSIYYNVNNAPYAYLNGVNDFAFSSSADKQKASLLNAAMEEPSFTMNVETSISGGVISITHTLQALRNIENKQLYLMTAIVEKEVALEGSGIIFNNVLRSFVPSASGKVLSKNWKLNESQQFTLSYNIDAFVNAKALSVVAFIQNENTKEILQTITTDTTSVSIALDQLFVESNGIDIIVYPNPAMQYANIILSEIANSIGVLQVVNQQGGLVDIIDVTQGSRFVKLNTENYSEGVYFINYINNYERIIKKLIIIK